MRTIFICILDKPFSRVCMVSREQAFYYLRAIEEPPVRFHIFVLSWCFHESLTKGATNKSWWTWTIWYCGLVYELLIYGCGAYCEHLGTCYTFKYQAIFLRFEQLSR
ncbi:hypothetical protein RchiOBHm_Chr4g0417611 [Rosa chinensis]|uniref:Uncharacterized protein n=1 Tax=Rosa chinensis TaxID=74649 RepID=A0A2P6QXC7_ROSCH|nr:hypothetical protein RchiOBHm_Chr4g0417611 [Rosa chinensis]